MAAPGKSFRKGISLIELFEMFPDDAAAEQWLEAQRWGTTGKPSECPLCHDCGKLKATPTRTPLPYWCGGCRRHFSVRTGSGMHRSRIPLRKWVIAIYLWATSLKGVSSMKLHRDLDITQKSAYFLAQRLREAWSEFSGDMDGPVEVDETYVGGKAKNMHAHKRAELTGRGGVDKTAVVGAKDRETNQVSAKVIERTNSDTLHAFVTDHATEGATVVTDEHSGYQGIPHPHLTVRHSVSEYVNGMAHTNGIESFWAMLKRGYHGTFHHLSAKHLQRYIDEFATRHNLRSKDTAVMMSETVVRMAGKRLTYAELITDKGA